MSAIDDRESDPINKSMVESQKEDKDKINKTFVSGVPTKPSKAPKLSVDSQMKARKLLQNLDFNKLFVKRGSGSTPNKNEQDGIRQE